MLRKYIDKMARGNPMYLLMLGFLAVIAVGTVLLCLPFSSRGGEWTPFLPALFTATSATCVTGLVMYDTYAYWSTAGQVVLMCLIQIGGLGFMTFTAGAGFLLGKRLSLQDKLIMLQSLNIDEVDSIKKLTKHILLGTFLIQLAGVAAFSTVFIPEFGLGDGLFKSLFHTISSFCNAGMDLMGEKAPFSSLTSYRSNLIVNFTTMALLVIGGIGFFVWEDFYRNIRKGFHSMQIYSRAVLLGTVILISMGTILFLLFEFHNPESIGGLPLWEKFLSALFNMTSSRTAGFNTIGLNTLREETILAMLVFMFIGGASGSTAGGIKVGTAIVLVLAVFKALQGKKEVILWDRKIPEDSVLRALTITVVSFMIIAAVTLILLVTTETTNFIPLLFETISAYATVGLSMGATLELTVPGLIAVIVIMFFGRIGIFTIGLALALKFRSNSELIRYPETKFIIG